MTRVYAIVALIAVGGIVWWATRGAATKRAPADRSGAAPPVERTEKTTPQPAPPAAKGRVTAAALLAFEEKHLDELLPLIEARLTLMRAALKNGVVSQVDMGRALIEHALLVAARERGAPGDASHALETTTRELERRYKALAEHGVLSAADLSDQLARLAAARNALRWFRSPLRLGAAETTRAPDRPTVGAVGREDLERRIGELTARHLEQRRKTTARLPAGPAREIQLLLLRARQSEMPFPEAKELAAKSIETATLSRRDRDDLESLLGLFDYYATKLKPAAPR